MTITISRSGTQKVFGIPDGIREYIDGCLCEVGGIDDYGPYEFATVNFGKLRFQPMIAWDRELQRVNGWEFVAMAGLMGIYAKQKESA